MAHAKGLTRVAKLYALVEDLNAMQVRAATAAVREVEQAIEQLYQRHANAQVEARTGLSRGSRIEALVADQAATSDQPRLELLNRLAVESRTSMQAAQEAHRQTRMEARQMELLLTKQRAAEELLTERKLQSDSDDRFVSRREWLRVNAENEC